MRLSGEKTGNIVTVASAASSMSKSVCKEMGGLQEKNATKRGQPPKMRSAAKEQAKGNKPPSPREKRESRKEKSNTTAKAKAAPDAVAPNLAKSRTRQRTKTRGKMTMSE